LLKTHEESPIKTLEGKVSFQAYNPRNIYQGNGRLPLKKAPLTIEGNLGTERKQIGALLVNGFLL